MKAVILAGGEGKRLKPYTNILPKPLLPIGDTPLIEIVIERIKEQGGKDFFLLTNYKSDLFEILLGNGSRLGVNITYSREKNPLGTAGPLKNLEGILKGDFLVMNGDILTDLDFRELLKFHKEKGSLVTITTKKEKIKLNYGMIKSQESCVTGWDEKPVIKADISTGIYVLNSSVLRYIKKNERIDMPELVKRIIDGNGKVLKFPYNGRWIDIGRIKDFEEAAQGELKLFKYKK